MQGDREAVDGAETTPAGASKGEDGGGSGSTTRQVLALRLLVLGMLAALVLAFLIVPALRGFVREMGGYIVAGDYAALAEHLRSYGGYTVLLIILLMILQSIAAPVPPFPITMAAGLIFGPALGALVAWSGLQLGALLCFFLGRVFGRPFVVALFGATRIAKVDSFFKTWGLRAVLLARLLPLISIDAVSFAAGFTAMRFVAFMAATAFGLMPACLIYATAGANLAEDPKSAVVWLLAFWGVLLLAVVVMAWRRRRNRSRP